MKDTLIIAQTKEPYDSREGESNLICPKCGSENIFTFNKLKKWNTEQGFCRGCHYKANIDEFLTEY